VDETTFESSAALNGIVGVLVPCTVQLAPTQGFHARDATPSGRDEVMQRLLDAPVDVVGINVRSFQGSGDAWLSGVIELVEWTVRQMPLEGPTTLQVYVEQRGEHTRKSDWSAAFSHLQLQLCRRWPERYAQLQLSVRLQRKEDNPLNGYPDVVAHAWDSGSEDSRARLRQSRLEPGCLHRADAPALRSAWNLVSGGDGPPGAEWRKLLQDRGSWSPGTLLHERLGKLAANCRERPALWGRYLEEVLSHQQGKAVDLRVLGREVTWLASCGNTEAFPPALLLAWNTARLETANHEGRVDTLLEAELERLSALGAFRRLSLPAVHEGERLQTSAYLAISTMDLPGVPLPLVRERVSQVVSLVPADITRQAGDSSPATKYPHHVLLRYLVGLGTEEERAAYLAARGDPSATPG